MPGGGLGLRCGASRYRAVPPLKTQFQPFALDTACFAASRSEHRLPIEVIVQTVDASYAVHAGSKATSPVAEPMTGYGSARASGSPKRSGPKSPYGPSPAIGRTLV